MHPVLARFSLSGTEVVLRSYATFYVLAFVVALALAAAVTRRRGMSWWKGLLVFAGALAAGIVGARLLDLAVNWSYYAEDTSRIYDFGFRGFALYGGLILAVVTGALLARALHQDVWRLADGAVPALAAGIVLMRTGCFLNGCCFGTETSLPWGVTYPVRSPAWVHQVLTGKTSLLGAGGDVHPVHPTQLYEIAAALVLGGIATWMFSRGRPVRSGRRTGPGIPSGVPFLTFALGFTLFRLGNGFLRAQLPTATLPVWLYPVLYALIGCVVGALIIWRRRVALQALPRQEGDGHGGD